MIEGQGSKDGVLIKLVNAVFMALIAPMMLGGIWWTGTNMIAYGQQLVSIQNLLSAHSSSFDKWDKDRANIYEALGTVSKQAGETHTKLDALTLSVQGMTSNMDVRKEARDRQIDGLRNWVQTMVDAIHETIARFDNRLGVIEYKEHIGSGPGSR